METPIWLTVTPSHAPTISSLGEKRRRKRLLFVCFIIFIINQKHNSSSDQYLPFTGQKVNNVMGHSAASLQESKGPL